MSLDLSKLESLLSLPCFIPVDGSILTQCAILTKSHKICESVYCMHVLPKEDLQSLLKRVYESDGPYDMDCSVFAQLTSKVLDGTWPVNGGSIQIFIDAGCFMSWTEKHPKMGYIGIKNKKVQNHVNTLPINAKGR